MMSLEERRAAQSLLRAMRLIGAEENARFVERRLLLGTLLDWASRSSLAETILDETAGGLEVAARLVPRNTDLALDIRNGRRALSVIEEAIAVRKLRCVA